MPKDTNLHKAAYKGDVNVVVELLEQGDDVNCRGAQMRTPLHRAVGKGHNNCVEVLIKHNADLNMVDGGGLTPLHWAALFGLVETGKLLVNAKCDLNVTTKAGETALHLCAEKGKVEFVKFLLQAGARTDIKDKSMNGGLTPYEAAKKSGTEGSYGTPSARLTKRMLYDYVIIPLLSSYRYSTALLLSPIHCLHRPFSSLPSTSLSALLPSVPLLSYLFGVLEAEKESQISDLVCFAHSSHFSSPSIIVSFIHSFAHSLFGGMSSFVLSHANRSPPVNTQSHRSL